VRRRQTLVGSNPGLTVSHLGWWGLQPFFNQFLQTVHLRNHRKNPIKLSGKHSSFYERLNDGNHLQRCVSNFCSSVLVLNGTRWRYCIGDSRFISVLTNNNNNIKCSCFSFIIKIDRITIARQQGQSQKSNLVGQNKI
jgi:hypothetical protein